MRLRFGYIILVLSILGLFANKATACSCLGTTSPCGEYQAAAAVFIGYVTEVKIAEGFDTTKIIYPPGTAYLKVEQAFKEMKETDVVFPLGTGGDCIPVFKKGERWLIYASRDKKTNQLFPMGCSRNSTIERAHNDLLYLRALPEIATKTRVAGTLIHYDNEPGKGFHFVKNLSDIKITITSQQGDSHVVYTNGDGVYELVGLPVGRYKIHADIPDNLKAASYSKNDQEVTVSEGSCAGIDILAQSSNNITGKVFDEQGKIVPDICVNLVQADKANSQIDRKDVLWDYTNKDGLYEFKELSPGRYLLGVNLEKGPSGDAPFPKMYYPSVSDPFQATVIQVNEGTKLSNIDIHLPPRLVTKVIEVEVVFSDGRPATEGSVSLTESEAEEALIGYASEHKNVEGHYVLTVMQGTTGWLHAYGISNSEKARKGMFYAKSFKIDVTDDIKNLKIIIPLPDSK